MRKNFILDTSVLLYDPNAIFCFDDNTLIIPIEVIEELDGFKRDMTDLGQNARRAALTLDQLRRQGKLGEGVALPKGGLLRVHAGRSENYLANSGLSGSKVDNRLLNLAIELNETDPEVPTIIVSKSMNLRVKADALGIYTEGYEEPYFRDSKIYSGIHQVTMTEAELDQGERKDGNYRFPGLNLLTNEYLLVRSATDQEPLFMGRGNGGEAPVHPIIEPDEEEGLLGIQPLNLAQAFAVDALLDDSIRLVTLLGRAGTGKTLLAVAAGLHKIYKEDRYNRLLVSRPTLPMGRDIGYLPGDIDEKMRPWMQPIYDALELVREVDKRSRKRSLPPDLLTAEEVGVEPLTYIRGRSIPHQYMVIDEAQNLTPLEVKTIITRVGRDTKIVLTGDCEQIDNPYVDAVTNGLVYVINRFRGARIAAHVTLEKGERSELAELAANVL